MIRIAAAGHRTLCLGQGAELCWARDPQPLSSLEVLDIFRQKTAPAFEVALRLGAAFAGADEDVADVLTEYSEALGIAYQIRDDLDDLAGDDADRTTSPRMRPSLPLALAYERTKGDDQRRCSKRVWRRDGRRRRPSACAASIDELGRDGALPRAARFVQGRSGPLAGGRWRTRASRGCSAGSIAKIFSVEVKGWCSEFEARNAAGRAGWRPSCWVSRPTSSPTSCAAN